jgi:hypothetical protein
MKLQKMKIAQPTKSLMLAAPELPMMMVMTEMTLVVVPHLLSYKEEVMSDLSLSLFTANQLTHCTQDQDHNALTSSTISLSTANASVDSWIDDVPVPDPYTYHIIYIHSQQSIQ